MKTYPVRVNLFHSSFLQLFASSPLGIASFYLALLNQQILCPPYFPPQGDVFVSLLLRFSRPPLGEGGRNFACLQPSHVVPNFFPFGERGKIIILFHTINQPTRYAPFLTKGTYLIACKELAKRAIKIKIKVIVQMLVDHRLIIEQLLYGLIKFYFVLNDS